MLFRSVSQSRYDAQLGVKVLPPSGMVFADKGYDTADFLQALSDKGLHSGVIKKIIAEIKIKTLIYG